MGELEEKLENILGNPQAMAQIMSLAQSLNLGGPGQAAQSQDPPPQQPQDAAGGDKDAPPAASPPPPAGPAGSGAEQLDQSIQIAKLSRLIRSGLELLRARKEDGHV